MRTPPFLLGAALLFWGWRAEMLLVGVMGAIILEAANLLKARWEFSDKEFNRIWDVCTILFFGAGLYLRFSEEVTNGAYKFFAWFPIIFFPMALGQVYSAREKIPYKAFSWFLRRKRAEGQGGGLNITWIYLGICLVASGATNKQDIWFFMGVCGLTGWAVWANRAFRFPGAAWAASFILAAALGFVTQMQLPRLQSWFEGRASEWFSKWARKDFDPRESKTAMGRLGRLKQSSRVIMRVTAEEGEAPERLRQGMYDHYREETWRSTKREFKDIPIESDTTTWTLSTSTNTDNLVKVSARLFRERTTLSLPLTARQIQDLPVDTVETNALRAARSFGNPALASYRVVWGGSTEDELPPEGADIFIEEGERAVLARAATEIGASGLPDAQKVAAVERFFSGFKYTTYQTAAELGFHAMTPLSRFLQETRAGHCEYFATATVLLLRHLKVPARYVTGYAIQEKTAGGSYIVRERHAHAWALAYVNGDWVEVDTTPADWLKEEAEEFPFYQKAKDLWARLTFAFTEFRWSNETGWLGTIAPWLLMLAASYLAWRIFGRRLKKTDTGGLREGNWPGADSEVFLLEKKLSGAGLGRLDGETSAEWLTRARENVPALDPILRELLTLHYRYRFDPVGIGASERDQLRSLVKSALLEV